MVPLSLHIQNKGRNSRPALLGEKEPCDAEKRFCPGDETFQGGDGTFIAGEKT